MKCLCDAFEKLNCEPYSIGIVLDNQYSQESLQQGLTALKDDDLYRFKILDQVNQRLSPENRLSFYICNANLKLYQNSDEELESNRESIEYDLDDEWESEDESEDEEFSYQDIFISGKWYKDGQPLNKYFQSYDMDSDFFTKIYKPCCWRSQNDLNIFNIKLWDEPIQHEDHIDCEIGSIIAHYNKYLLVLWPEKYEVNFEVKLKEERSVIQDFYFHIFDKDLPIDDATTSRFDRIMSYFSAKLTKIQTLTNIGSYLMQLIIRFDQVEKARVFFDKFIVDDHDEHARNIVQVIVHFGIDSLKDNLKCFFTNSKYSHFSLFNILNAS